MALLTLAVFDDPPPTVVRTPLAVFPEPPPTVADPASVKVASASPAWLSTPPPTVPLSSVTRLALAGLLTELRPPPPIVAECTPGVTALSALPPITLGLWLVPSEAGSVRRPRALFTRRLSAVLSVVPRKSEEVVPALPPSCQKPPELIPSRASAFGARPRVASFRSVPVRLPSPPLAPLPESAARSELWTCPAPILPPVTAPSRISG